MHEILAEIPEYQCFLNFCKTDQGAFALLEKEIRTCKITTLIHAMFDEIVFNKRNTIKLFFGISESLSKDAIRSIQTESPEERENAQTLELLSFASALRAELDMEKESKYSDSKKIYANEDSEKN